MSWQCPHCGSKNLRVNATVFGLLIQPHHDDFETEVAVITDDARPSWDDDSYMMCMECDFNSNAADFNEDVQHG